MTRPFEGKKDFFLLDHAGNVMRHGFPEDEREAVIKPLKSRKDPVPRIFTCEHCYAVVASLPCSECGKAPTVEAVRQRLLEIEPGVLKELTKQRMFADIRPIQVQMEVSRLKDIQVAKGYKPGWIYHQLKNKFGEQIANEHYRK